MKRTPLRRGDKPLKANKPLERHVGLAQVGRRRQQRAEAEGKPVRATLSTRVPPAVPDDLRADLKKRSKGYCEMALPGCLGVATDPAHRISRKTGGRKRAGKARLDRLSVILHACRRCHDWSEARPAESYDLGLKIKENAIPTQEPVVYRGILSYLDDEGGVHDALEVGA